MLLTKIDGNFNYLYSISQQIASLINTNNHLHSFYRPENVLSRIKEYSIIYSEPLVIGCVKAEKQSYTFTEIKHLSILTPFRGLGLAKPLVQEAINKSNTPLIYATIRNENSPSIKTFKSLGFQECQHYYTEEVIVKCFMRRR